MKIGVLGGGQLGRMLALAGYPLGMSFRFLDPAPGAPAGEVGEVWTGSFHDADLLDTWVEGLDLVTTEFENVPARTAAALARHVPVMPGAGALAVCQDRVEEKLLFDTLGVPTAPWRQVETLEQLLAALDDLGYPVALKTRRDGYDGKGQARIMRPADVEAAWHAIGSRPAIVEQLIPFDREVSLVAARARDGGMVFYPLVENEHRDGILHLTRAPAPAITPRMELLARSAVTAIAAKLRFVGVITLEMFVRGGELLANEIAPRVHNSGHWTIEGAVTSQFENHLRAIAGLPLGETAARAPTAMINLVGSDVPAAHVLAVRGTSYHTYGKAPRAGRKLGHITVTASDDPTLEQRIAEVMALLPRPAPVPEQDRHLAVI